MNNEWIKEGARVAETSGWGDTRRAELTTIERLTPTQIVTATGRRFNRDDDLDERGNGRRVLRPLTSEVVRATVGRQELDHLTLVVERLVRTRPADSAAVYRVLDEITAEVQRIREATRRPWSTIKNDQED